MFHPCFIVKLFQSFDHVGCDGVTRDVENVALPQLPMEALYKTIKQKQNETFHMSSSKKQQCVRNTPCWVVIHSRGH